MTRIAAIAIFTFIILTLSLAGLESYLRFFDPWGLCYFEDIRTIAPHSANDPQRGKILRPGKYELTHWKATMNETRLVPDTRPAAASIAMLGDSITFGWGVNDEETFTNLLARRFRKYHFINTGIRGYNSENVLRTWKTIKADAYIYMIVNNDNRVEPLDLEQIKRDSKDLPLLWAQRYWNFHNGIRKRGQNTYAKEPFFSHLDEMHRAGVHFVTFNYSGWLVEEIQKRYPDTTVIRDPANQRLTISVIDAHPNAEGHKFIAAQVAAMIRTMQPYRSDTRPVARLQN